MEATKPGYIGGADLLVGLAARVFVIVGSR